MGKEMLLTELKQLLEILPYLEKDMDGAYIALLEEQNSNWGNQENGFVYHVRPSVQSSYDTAAATFDVYNARRWELIKELNLTASIKGVPDFGESNIKPYGLTDHEKYKMERLFNFNEPIGLP